MARIPTSATYSVCFLSVKAEDKLGTYDHFIGTAFFIEVGGGDSRFVYLVTAKHVLTDAKKEGCAQVFARLNRHGDDSDTVPLPDVSEWACHDNPGVDIAVVAFNPPSSVFSYVPLPVEMFCGRAVRGKLRIRIGDDLIIAGLFRNRWGHGKNIPVVRSGMIAAMPDEPLEVYSDEDGDGEEEVYYYDAYLAEARSIGGLSGSPVFVIKEVPPPDLTAEEAKQPSAVAAHVNAHLRPKFQAALLGVVRGHWSLKRQGEDSLASKMEAKEIDELNAGIAVVTPAWDVLDVLNGDKLMKQRQEATAKRRKRDAPTLDSSLPPKRPAAEGITREGFEDALRRASRKTSEPESETEESE